MRSSGRSKRSCANLPGNPPRSPERCPLTTVEMPTPESTMSGQLAFHRFDTCFLEHSSRWLQDLEIREMIDSGEFSAERQREWFNGLAAREDYFIWGISLEGLPVGAVGLKNIGDGVAEYFGYLGDKSCWGRGLGHQMLAFAEQEARKLGLSLLRLRVLDTNHRASRLYQRAGYLFCLRPDANSRVFVKPLGGG